MPKILIQKQEDVFYPYDDEAAKYIGKLGENEILTCEIKRPRNPLYHSRAFKMLRIMHEMIETELGFEPWRYMLIILAGYCNTVGEVTKDGTTKVYVYPQSLSFENMEDDEFRTCFNDLVNAFGAKYSRDLTLEQLEEYARI